MTAPVSRKAALPRTWSGWAWVWIDVADRQGGAGTDRGQQRLALDAAAAAVDHGHAALADDEAEIGDAAGVRGGEVLLAPWMDEHARRHLGHLQRYCRRGRRAQPQTRAAATAAAGLTARRAGGSRRARPWPWRPAEAVVDLALARGQLDVDLAELALHRASARGSTMAASACSCSTL